MTDNENENGSSGRVRQRNAMLAVSVFVSGFCFVEPLIARQVESAAELLPGTVIAYAEVAELGDVIEMIRQHPLCHQIGSMPIVQTISSSDDLRPMRDVQSAFEAGMGGAWNEAIAELTDGGIAVGFDAETEGVALLIRSSNRERLNRFRGVVLAVSQLGQGNFEIAKQSDYRGFTAFAMNDRLKMAIVDDWFVVTNRSELGKSIIDRYLDGGQDSLRAVKRFESFVGSNQRSVIKGYLDLETIRASGFAPQLYSGLTENVVAEALFGGIVANLRHTPLAIGSIDASPSGVKLTLATPFEPAWCEGRQYYFGEDSAASAPPLLEVSDRMFALSTHRDLSQMWMRAPDLMTDQANEDLTKADTNLTTFFSGRDFAEDILGSLHPGIQLVVQRGTFEDQSPVPAIKLPSFAIQFQMKTPEQTLIEFRRVFQNVVGFINVVGAMQGQPQLDLGFEQIDQATLITATYVPPRDDQDQVPVPINYNFSPTIAFVGDRMLVSSSAALARALAHSDASVAVDQDHPNTVAVLSAGSLADALQDNQRQLVAQNMLEKGHGIDQANAEIELLFEIVRLFNSLSADLDIVGDQLTLSTELRLSE